MDDRLIIIGAGGHGRVAADIAGMNGYDVSFLDDRQDISANAALCGKVSDVEKFLDNPFFVAIGDPDIRRDISMKITNLGGRLVTLLHPNSVCHPNVHLGIGSIVMAGAVLSTNAAIGNGAIINTCSSVDHDCVVGDFCHISVGAHLAGTVSVGDYTMIGAGATIINNISICGRCVVAAGAVVVKNITDRGTYMGVPAVKKVK